MLAWCMGEAGTYCRRPSMNTRLIFKYRHNSHQADMTLLLNLEHWMRLDYEHSNTGKLGFVSVFWVTHCCWENAFSVVGYFMWLYQN